VLRILAISGSLRLASSNTALLRAAAQLAPEGVEVVLYTGIGELPHFNPDLEGSEPPSVLGFRDALQCAAGVLFSTPEYAHGVPGVLKNALDWVVGSGELMDKPVALLNASARGAFAQASLTETLTVMTARMVTEASVTIPLGKNLDDAAILAHTPFRDALRAALDAFARAIAAGQAQRGA
jgi:NAD(P)H-dependent FMN reductase